MECAPLARTGRCCLALKRYVHHPTAPLIRLVLADLYADLGSALALNQGQVELRNLSCDQQTHRESLVTGATVDLQGRLV